MLKDVGRLISFRDVLYYVGDQLYRRSLRYTGLTAAVSLLGYLGNFIPGVDTYNAKIFREELAVWAAGKLAASGD